MRFLVFLLGCSVVSFCLHANAQQPIKAPESAPFYKLSNFRIEDDTFGRPAVVCDYERTKAGDGNHSVKIFARTSEGKLDIMGFDSIIHQESGEIRLSKSFGIGRNRSYNYEIYLESPVEWAGKSYGTCMVSNAVRLGNPGPATRARAWNSDETAAHQKHQLGKLPPESAPPNGYEFQSLTSNLLPGMPVVFGEYGEWKPAEFLGFTDNGEANLRKEGKTEVVAVPVEKWVAVDPNVLKEGEEKPEAFEPSGEVLKDGKYVIPRDAVPVDYTIKLVPGTPLLIERAGKWTEVILTKRNGTSLRYLFTHATSMSFSRTEPMTKFAIKKSVVEQLSKPNTVALFAENLKSGEDFNFPGVGEGGGNDPFDGAPDIMREAMDEMKKLHKKHRIREYEIESPIPKNCQIVPDDLEIPQGTKVAACFHSDWSAATVLADNGDGTLEIDWDEYNSAWNGPVVRNQLIIQNKSLKKIKLDSAMTPSKLSKITRTWTDSSGQFSIDAKFVSKTDKEVTLRKEDGEEKTLLISKLSEKDRDLLKNLQKDIENPFEG